AELLGTGHASDHIEEIVPAARYGRIDALLVADSRPQWGRFEGDHHQVMLHASAEPGDEDLVNYAAIQTLLNGGTIYTVEPEVLPNSAALAAIFRY
ncbi:MAG TPA: hypothetical protein VFB21_17750, partial [Chthonomonadaceae bacterium]|nr:hypothetical protein [Chthonomonadaceae bacterium]